MPTLGRIKYLKTNKYQQIELFLERNLSGIQCIFNIASICNSYMGSILEILILTGVHAYQNLQKRSHFRTSRKERKKKKVHYE